jgi:hypothetical protein
MTNTIINDTRQLKEKTEYKFFVIAKDTFMSGWGRAKNGISGAVWACNSLENLLLAYKWVESRSDMTNVIAIMTEKQLFTHIEDNEYAHVSIYKVENEHPLLNN